MIDPKIEQKPGSAALARYVPLAAIALGLVLFFAFGLDRYFSIETLRENRAALSALVEARPVLALAGFMALYAGAVAISFPGASILTVFGGFLFGLWPGVPAIVLAASAGASVIFLASKTALGSGLRKAAGGFAARMEAGFAENAFSYMLLLRLAPVFPFWAVNIGAGLVGARFHTFFFGTLIGIIPGTFVYASIGNAAGAAFDAGEDVTLTGILTQPTTLLPIVGLIILALVPILLKKFAPRSRAGQRK